MSVTAAWCSRSPIRRWRLRPMPEGHQPGVERLDRVARTGTGWRSAGRRGVRDPPSGPNRGVRRGGVGSRGCRCGLSRQDEAHLGRRTGLAMSERRIRAHEVEDIAAERIGELGLDPLTFRAMFGIFRSAANVQRPRVDDPQARWLVVGGVSGDVSVVGRWPDGVPRDRPTRGLSRAAISSAVNTLERDGLVDRRRESDDRPGRDGLSHRRRRRTT